MRGWKKKKSGNKDLLGTTLPKLAAGRVLRHRIPSTLPHLPSFLLPFPVFFLTSVCFLFLPLSIGLTNTHWASYHHILMLVCFLGGRQEGTGAALTGQSRSHLPPWVTAVRHARVTHASMQRRASTQTRTVRRASWENEADLSCLKRP